MALTGRIVAITSGIALAGAITGAMGGVLAISSAMLLLLHVLPPLELLGPSTAIGTVFGAVVAPAIAWSFLRHVSLARAVAGIGLGAGVGGAIGVLLGAASVNPYAPLALSLPPVPQGLAGALAGAALATGYLRWRSGKISIPAAPANEEL